MKRVFICLIAYDLYSELLALALLAADARGQTPDRPNILFCLADDQSYPHASAYGEPVINTHLQRIAILLPEDRLEEMRRLEIRIEHDHPEINTEPGPYHPDVDWLTARGYDARLAKKVHVTRAASLLERHNKPGDATKPLKVYILAGQSNMEGQGAIHTFPAIADDADAAPLLKEMLDDEGKPVVCEKVWITYPAVERHGKLTAGFAFHESNIGPEFKAKTITPEEEALWERGGSNGDYHYLGSSKTFAQIGKAFAEAMLEMGQK